MKATSLLCACALGAILLAAPAAAPAQMSITLFTGYAGSSGVENVSTGSNADMESAPTYSAALGMVLDGSRELQLYFSQQSTTLSPGGGAAPFDLKIRYLHIGGTVFIDRPISQGLYAVGGVGVTQFSPGTSGYGDEVKPSINLGLGYYLPLGDHVALRAEARGYFTLVNSSGGFLCSGGCVAVLKSEAVTQYEAKIGLMARF